MTVTILQGSAIDQLRQIEANSVHMVLTSPPYWGLRSYGTEPQIWGGDPDCCHSWGLAPEGKRRGRPHGKSSALVLGNRAVAEAQRLSRGPTFPERASGRRPADPVPSDVCGICGAWRGEHGQEPTLALWLQNEVAIFAEVRRVLRPDGTLWVNMGDAYATSSNGRSAADQKDAGTDDRTFRDKPFSTVGELKAKNRLMLPARLALALQDDGWFLRDEIVWAKPNPMPSSVKDRTCPAHEFIHVFSKRPRYYFDHVAIMEPAVSDHPSGNGFDRPEQLSRANPDGSPRGSYDEWTSVGGMRMKRSVWTVPSEPFPDAHFATFPTALVEPCILAGTSHRGVCPCCGTPWVRETERTTKACSGSGRAQPTPAGWDQGDGHHGSVHRNGRRPIGGKGHVSAQVREDHDVRSGPVPQIVTTGWVQACRCPPAEPVPAVVLDIFGGSGTTGLVADYLGRSAVLIELNPDYAAMATTRIRTALGRVADDKPPATEGLALFDATRAAA